MDRNKPIEDQANEYYASRFADIAELLTRADDDDEAREQLYEMPLSVELVTIRPHRDECEWEILLGTGGPADRVLVTTTLDGDIDQAEYQYQDWFEPWTWASDQDRELVERFASIFYFPTVSVDVDGASIP